MTSPFAVSHPVTGVPWSAMTCIVTTCVAVFASHTGNVAVPYWMSSSSKEATRT